MDQLRLFYITITIIVNLSIVKCGNMRRFPEKFTFGASTASYQIEGAWNVSDKGESIWDYMTHHHPESMVKNATGDVACDSYHHYKEDVQLLYHLGVDFYRFSISWPRLLPTGFSNVISEDGKRYYNDLIDELLANNIKPVITLYHWDLPQSLQKLGGWANPLMADYFEDYARIAFEEFGDRVKTWLTFNEPQVFCSQGYGNTWKAPQLNMSGIADYLCAYTVILAHAKAYHLYDKKFRRFQKGRVGLTISAGFSFAASNSPEDIEAAEIAGQFEVGMYVHPMFSKEGGYPRKVQERINRISKEQGFARSRLPAFTPAQIEYIKGTHDFFGLNHYTSNIYSMRYSPSSNIPNAYDDIGVTMKVDKSWPSTIASWFKVVPVGFRNILNWIKNQYDNPEIIVFENGYVDDTKSDNPDRVNYYRDYLSALLDAIDDGVNVTGYSAWSLLDNLEWQSGYSQRFGLVYVDFDSPNRTRTPKDVAYYYKYIIETRSVEFAEIIRNMSVTNIE